MPPHPRTRRKRAAAELCHLNTGDANPLIGSGGPAGSGGGAAWRGAGLPPLYVDLVNDVQDHLRQIEDKMKRLDGVHRQRLKVTFDDGKEAELEHEIDILTREITRHFGVAGNKLKEIHAAGAKATTDKSTDSSVRRNLQRALASKLHEHSTAFRKAQKGYMTRLQNKKGGGVDLLGTGGATGASEAKDTGFSDAQMSEVVEAEALAKDRDQEIVNIAKSINDLAVIFKELATLIIDQGTVLDRIDYNMEQVVDHVTKGVKELEKAEEYQKSSRPKKCIAFLLILITIMVVMLIMKHKKSSDE